MRWRLILALSMFGLAMAAGTIAVLPSRVAGLCWVVIFVVTSILVSRRAGGRYFLHGFLVGLTNCFWVTAAHVAFHSTYVAHHASEMAARRTLMPTSMPAPVVVLLGPGLAFLQRYDAPIPGLSGIIYGTLSWLFSKWPRRGDAG